MMGWIKYRPKKFLKPNFVCFLLPPNQIGYVLDLLVLHTSQKLCGPKNVSYDAKLCPIIAKSQRAPNAQLTRHIVDRHFEELKSYCADSQTFNSLTAIDGHDRQYFNELRSTVVSYRIFIRSQSLIAR
jgi:hypothetical protein